MQEQSSSSGDNPHGPASRPSSSDEEQESAQEAKPHPREKSNRVSFPLKLHTMLSKAEVSQTPGDGSSFSSTISWLPGSSSAFRVHNPDAFVEDVMPKFFEMTKYRSFLRQLKLWSFELDRSRESPTRGSYSHPLFVRDQPDLCKQMKRVKTRGMYKRKRRQSSESPTQTPSAGTDQLFHSAQHVAHNNMIPLPGVLNNPRLSPFNANFESNQSLPGLQDTKLPAVTSQGQRLTQQFVGSTMYQDSTTAATGISRLAQHPAGLNSLRQNVHGSMPLGFFGIPGRPFHASGIQADLGGGASSLTANQEASQSIASANMLTQQQSPGLEVEGNPLVARRMSKEDLKYVMVGMRIGAEEEQESYSTSKFPTERKQFPDDTEDDDEKCGIG